MSELKSKALEMGLEVSGTKAALMERLRQGERGGLHSSGGKAVKQSVEVNGKERPITRSKKTKMQEDEVNSGGKSNIILVHEDEGKSIMCQSCKMWLVLDGSQKISEEEMEKCKFICAKCRVLPDLKAYNMVLVEDVEKLQREMEALRDRLKNAEKANMKLAGEADGKENEISTLLGKLETKKEKGNVENEHAYCKRRGERKVDHENAEVRNGMNPRLEEEAGKWKEVRSKRKSRVNHKPEETGKGKDSEKIKEYQVPSSEEIVKAIRSWKLGKREEKLDGLIEGSSIVKFWRGQVRVPKGKVKVVSHSGAGLGDILFNSLINLQVLKIGGRLVIQGGGNDLMELKEEEVAIWRAWMEKMKECYPDVKIAVIPILPRKYAGSVYDRIRRVLNKKIRILAFESMNNTIEMGEDWNNWRRWLRLDGIHLNQLGVAAMIDGVNSWMSSSLPSRSEKKQ